MKLLKNSQLLLYKSDVTATVTSLKKRHKGHKIEDEAKVCKLYGKHCEWLAISYFQKVN